MQRTLMLSLPFVALLAASAGAQFQVPDPGPSWTGRWIIHVQRDDAAHRSTMRAIGAARRARNQEVVDDLVADYRRAIEARHLPVIDAAIEGGAAVLDTTWIASTVVLENASPELLEALAARSDVARIQPDTWARAQLGVATDAAHHNSDAANQLLTSGGALVDGTGVTVAIVDSGIDANHAGSGRPHAAFFPNGNPATPTGAGIAGSRVLSAISSSVFGGGQPAEDTFGHGTRMASIAVGAEFNGLPDVDDGPAFNANVRSYKISDDAAGGLASVLSMDNAFQDLLQDVDVVVANMSYDGTHDPLFSPNPAIESATLADVFVSLSAGNFGTSLGTAHACYNALVVGASDVSTKEPLVLPGSVISAIGPLNDGRKYPQLLAVGEALTCAQMDAETGSIDSSGTSGAAALVAGTAALVRQADSTLSQLEIKAILLNTSEAVTLGNPDAAGFGYLRSDRAVEAALAGDVVQESIATGVVKKYVKFFAPAEEVVLTLVWNREGPFDQTIDDLDLRLRAPSGSLIAWSASTVDNIEQIRASAPQAGIYEIEVVPIHFDGDGSATYALAGVDTTSVDPSACTGSAPIVLQQSPPAIPALTTAYVDWMVDNQPINVVTLIGCNFTGTSLVQVGAQLFPATAIDDNTLTFEIGIPAQIGAVPITIFASGGVGVDTLDIVPASNVLATTPTIDFGNLQLDVGGNPGDFYAVAFSPKLVPTVVPGFLSVDIGAGGTALYPFLFGNLNAVNGVNEHSFGALPGIVGQAFHFQAVTLNATTLALPWKSTNVGTAYYFQ